jgi:hypothetical protein
MNLKCSMNRIKCTKLVLSRVATNCLKHEAHRDGFEPRSGGLLITVGFSQRFRSTLILRALAQLNPLD